VRFVSCEPLSEDISQQINLDGVGWLIAGGESGTNPEYRWDPQADWRKEMQDEVGHRTMKNQWAWNLYMKSMYAGHSILLQAGFLNQVRAGRRCAGEIIHQMPSPSKGLVWAPTE